MEKICIVRKKIQRGFLLKTILEKKNEMIINDPKIAEKIFLISKFIIKYILDRMTITKKILPVGLCLVKKDIPKTTGKKNQ